MAINSFNPDLTINIKKDPNKSTNLFGQSNTIAGSVFGQSNDAKANDLQFNSTFNVQKAIQDKNDTRSKNIGDIMTAANKIGLDTGYNDVNELSDTQLTKIQKYMSEKNTTMVDGQEKDITDTNIMHLIGITKEQTESNLKTADRTHDIQENNYGQRYIDAYKAANDGKDPTQEENQYGCKVYDNFYWGDDPKTELAAMVEAAKAKNPNFVDVDPKATSKTTDTAQVVVNQQESPVEGNVDKSVNPQINNTDEKIKQVVTQPLVVTANNDDKNQTKISESNTNLTGSGSVSSKHYDFDIPMTDRKGNQLNKEQKIHLLKGKINYLQNTELPYYSNDKEKTQQTKETISRYKKQLQDLEK